MQISWSPADSTAWELHAPVDNPGIVTLTLNSIPSRHAAGVVEAMNIKAARELRDALTAAINRATTLELFFQPPYIHTPTGSGDTRPLDQAAAWITSRP